MGMTFYNLTDDELCDLMCGCPDHDDDESEIAGYCVKEADNEIHDKPCQRIKY